MKPEIDYVKLGQRIKAARQERGLTQADLGALTDCSNNHISHLETGLTKISLEMLLKISQILEKDFDYFFLDTPYARREYLISTEIADKLAACDTLTLIAVNRMIDILLEQQKMFQNTQKENM